jgi:hypothetical protein
MRLTLASLEKIEEYKKELIVFVNDPILQRIIESYSPPEPVENMEAELDKILKEVLHEENKELNSSGL